MNVPIAHVGGGVFEPLQIAGLAVIGIGYARRAHTLADRGRPVPPWRMACFAGGLLLIAVSLGSPIAHVGEELILAHMAQHLLMGDIGALLMVAGLTGPMLQPLLAIRWIGWMRHLTHPLVALPLWIVNLYVWHLPVLYQASLSSDVVHALQHTCFIGFGILMWMPVVGPLPVPRWFGIGGKLAYIVGVRFAATVLGNVFMWANTVFYPDYASGQAYWGIDPITDQGIAGVIMVAEGGIITLAGIAWLFLRWAQQDAERQRLLDLADAQGVPLDAERAGRAVAAGAGARLEERVRSGRA